MEHANRAGYFMNSTVGYKAFVPAKLPPEPPIEIDAEMQSLLSLADRKLGRLDGITQILPNPELFVAMYVKKEAVLSSQIEGTQASFVDVLSAEYNQMDDQRRDDISEVVNYVNAMNWGLNQLETFPPSPEHTRFPSESWRIPAVSKLDWSGRMYACNRYLCTAHCSGYGSVIGRLGSVFARGRLYASTH